MFRMNTSHIHVLKPQLIWCMSTQEIMFLTTVYFALNKSKSIEKVVCRGDAIPSEIMTLLIKLQVLEAITSEKKGLKGFWYEGGELMTENQLNSKDSLFFAKPMYLLDIKRYFSKLSVFN